jgi:maleate cis-trans isomerase
MPEVSKSFLDFLAEAGIGVGAVKDVRCGPTQRTFELDYDQELRDFVATLPERQDPIVIPSTSLNSLYRIEEFEAIAGRPVLTANQVTMWYSLELAGAGVSIKGMGRLFRS